MAQIFVAFSEKLNFTLALQKGKKMFWKTASIAKPIINLIMYALYVVISLIFID